MRITLPRVICAALFATATAWSASAETYQCENAGGCLATITTRGVQREVTFRKGDIVDTDSGWVVDLDQGWKEVMQEIERNR